MRSTTSEEQLYADLGTPGIQLPRIGGVEKNLHELGRPRWLVFLDDFHALAAFGRIARKKKLGNIPDMIWLFRANLTRNPRLLGHSHVLYASIVYRFDNETMLLQPYLALIPRLFPILCTVVLVSVVCHWTALTGEFVYDDIPAVVENVNARLPLQIGGIFSEPYWGLRPGAEQISLIRPVVTLSFALNEAVTGFIPEGYRAVNVFLHCVASCLVVLLALALRVPPLVALFAGALFASHPIHCEAIAATANRTEPMCAVFYLGALLCYFQARESVVRTKAFGAVCGFLTLFMLALGSKEVAITLPVVVVAFELVMCLMGVPASWGGGIKLSPDRTTSAVTTAVHINFGAYKTPPGVLALGVLLILTSYLTYRSAFLASPFSANVLPGDNPLVGADGTGRWATPMAQLALAMELMWYPVRLSVDYTMAVLPVVAEWSNLSLWCGIGWLSALIGGLIFSVRSKNLPIAAGICLFGGTYGLVSNTAVLATILFAERVMYLPSAGLCIAIASVAGWATRDRGRVVKIVTWVIAITVLVGLGTRSWIRNLDWQNDARLFESSLLARPNSSRLHTNLGRLAMVSNNVEVAAHHLDTALQIHAENAQALLLRGQLARRLGRVDDAQGYFERANKAHNGRNGRALGELCAIFSELKQLSRADEACRRAVELRPDHPDTWTAVGDFAAASGDATKAEAAYRRALHIAPTNLHALNRLGGLLAKARRYIDLLDVMHRIFQQNRDNRDLAQDLAGLTTKIAAEAVRAKDVDLARDVLLRARNTLGDSERWEVMLRSLPSSGVGE